MKQKHNKKNRAPKKHLNPDEQKEREKKDAFRQGQQDNSTSAGKEVQPDKKNSNKNQEYSGKITNEDTDVTNNEEQNRLSKLEENESEKNMDVEIPPFNPETEIQPPKM